MWTWHSGRQALAHWVKGTAKPLGVFLTEHESCSPLRIPGTAFYMSGNPGITPPALLHNLRHNKVLHERVVILNVRTEDVPHIPPEDRLSIDCLALGFWRIALRFGFMDEPDVPRELQRISGETFSYDAKTSSFFLGRESIIGGERSNWRRALFAWMSRQARDATSFFRLPASSV